MLEAGKKYTFKVCPQGKRLLSAKWSEEVTAYFKTSTPITPAKPVVKVTGTREALITVTRPAEHELSRICYCVVELTPEDGNATEWSQTVCPLKQGKIGDIKMRVGDLEEHRCY